MAVDPVYLVELTGYSDAGTSAVYRYATAGYITAPTDTPANTWYEPRVSDPGSIVRSLFAAGASGIRANPRARSAKLRAAVRTDAPVWRAAA